MSGSNNISKSHLAAGIVVILLGALAVIFIPNWFLDDLTQSPVWLWMAGAGALGMVSGLTTGLSTEKGSGQAFVTFLGTGLLVPILGGVAAFLGQTEKVTEESTYANDQLVKKITETVTSFSDGPLLHPLAVLGSFFLAFGVLAILGIIGGALLRKSRLIEIMLA
jgi:ribose/xylose/arabinose/galactoside ABC-type transport system permease subunit